MILVDRDRLHDGQLILPQVSWVERAENQTNEVIKEGPSHIVTGLYRDPAVKAALEKLFNKKCAYCESPGVDWDVEHFRPKASVAEDRTHPGYYWLAYTWTNLYPSCVFCNQRRKDQPTFDDPTLGPTTGKLDQFPLADEKKRARGPADSIADEDPLLINPCNDTPSLHLTFDVAGAISAKEGSLRGVTSIRVFGLDRRRLRDARRDVLGKINDLIEELVAGGHLAGLVATELPVLGVCQCYS